VDEAKCNALKASLADKTEPQVVPIERFFDGNNDLRSIGCNLDPHPGIERFRRILTGLTSRPDVEVVYTQISELDPGEGCWPFADKILIVGTISAETLRQLVKELEPDEVGEVDDEMIPLAIAAKHTSPVSVVWWD
jgi:hypothetical protein